MTVVHKNIVIIGAGRAGINCAIHLLSSGVTSDDIIVIDRTKPETGDIPENLHIEYQWYVLKLVIESNRMQGVIAIDKTTGEIISIKTNSVVLATGGYASLYSKSAKVDPTGYCGGIQLALEAGAYVGNMEMIDFAPFGIVSPDRFREIALPTEEITRTSILTDGSVLDVTSHPKEFVLTGLPETYGILKREGIDILKERVELTPLVVNTFGGIIAEPETAMTHIEGLYAVGDSVMRQIHCDNRVADMSVRIIHTNPHSLLSDKGFEDRCTQELTGLRTIPDLDKLRALQSQLSRAMWKTSGVARSESLLLEGAHLLGVLADGVERNAIEAYSDKVNIYQLCETRELVGSILASVLIVKASLMRQESRGMFNRTDYGAISPGWENKQIIFTKNGPGLLDIEPRVVDIA
jgi:succinate dehydrogenase/fumarate reductase flavoprotein subunit